MPGMSIHVVDVSRGVVAAGMRVAVFATTPARRALAEGRIGAKGLLEHPTLADMLAAAEYREAARSGGSPATAVARSRASGGRRLGPSRRLGG